MRRALLALRACVLLGLAPLALGHEIPVDVVVKAFLEPEGQRLRLLVRAPLGALRDVEVPTRGPGYLDLARAEATLRSAAKLWIVDALELFEGEARLGAPRLVAARVSLPSDRSFGSYEEALAHFEGAPLPNETELYWSQGLLDLELDYPIRAEDSRFSIRTGLGRLGQRVQIALQFLSPSGGVRAFELGGDEGLVRLDPLWHQAAGRFVRVGFRHILEGTDHLLFLLCLVVPFRRWRRLVLIVTSFTLAHSITLIASARGFVPDALWFPPLVETLIAVSVVYLALENVVVTRPQGRFMVVLGFGLIHGFGFSFALRDTLQFAGSHLLTSLFSFNLGVELGQLLVLVVLVPALNGLFRLVGAERVLTIVLSALVAHAGWHWTLERFERLRQFRIEWPPLDAARLASLSGWLLLLTIAAASVWLLALRLPPARRAAGKEAAAGPD